MYIGQRYISQIEKFENLKIFTKSDIGNPLL